MDDDTYLETCIENLSKNEFFNDKIKHEDLQALMSPLLKMKEHDVELNKVCGKLITSKNMTSVGIRLLLKEISSRCAKTIGSCNAILEASRNITSELTWKSNTRTRMSNDIHESKPRMMRIIEVTSTQECPHFVPDETRINKDGIEEMYAACALVLGMECEVHSTIRGDSECKCEDPFPADCPLDKKVKKYGTAL